MKEPHIWTPEHDPQPPKPAETPHERHMKELLERTMAYLRSLPKREERVDGR